MKTHDTPGLALYLILYGLASWGMSGCQHKTTEAAEAAVVPAASSPSGEPDAPDPPLAQQGWPAKKSACAQEQILFEGRCIIPPPYVWARQACPSAASLETCNPLVVVHFLGIEGAYLSDDRAWAMMARICSFGEDREDCVPDFSVSLSDLWYERNEQLEQERLTQCKEHGDAVSCYNLGHFYQRSITHKDRDRAFEFFVMACDAGLMQGCVMSSPKFREDPVKYESVLSKGCEGGELGACYMLGKHRMEANSRGAAHQDALALQDFACRAGDVIACSALARLYLKGEYGVAQDKEKGAMYYKQGCDMGFAHSCKQLDALPPKLRQKACHSEDDGSCADTPPQDP